MTTDTSDTSATRDRTGVAATPVPGVVLDRLRAATPAAPSSQHGPPAAAA
jgi:hypothetical protein